MGLKKKKKPEHCKPAFSLELGGFHCLTTLESHLQNIVNQKNLRWLHTPASSVLCSPIYIVKVLNIPKLHVKETHVASERASNNIGKTSMQLQENHPSAK